MLDLQKLLFILNMDDKITEWNMAVIADCLHGSLRLRDRTGLWRFSEEQRESTLNKLYALMNAVESNAFKAKEAE